MARSASKLWLLLWKNYKLQVRHPVQTVVEVLIPVLFSCLIVVVRSLVSPEEIPDNSTFVPFHAWPSFNFRLPPTYGNGSGNGNQSLADICGEDYADCPIQFKVAWSPRDDEHPSFTQEAERIMEIVGTSNLVTPVKYDNAEELEEELTVPGVTEINWNDIRNTSSVVLAGLILEDIEHPDDPHICSRGLQATIRFPGELRWNQQNMEPTPYYNWRTHLLFPMYQVNGPRERNENDGGYPRYRQEGFLSIQTLLAAAVGRICYEEHRQRTGYSPLGNFSAILEMLQLQRFSYPPYTEDLLLEALQSFISLMIMLSFVYTCIATVKVITTEKERQLKEAMKIMGLPGSLHWMAWFIKTIAFLLVSVTLIVILLKVRWYPHSDMTVFTLSSGTVIFVFMMLFMVTTTCFCFMISVFFTKANTAATIAGLAWFLSYAPYSFLSREYETMGLTTKLVVCLFSNTAMAYGFQIVIMHEGTGVGLRWSNVMEPATQDDNLAMGHVMLMLVADALIYLIITLYVEAVFPGTYGVPRPWYFLFQRSYWCGPRAQYLGDEDNVVSLESDNFEKEPQKLPVGVQIRKLRKVFSGNKVAVDNLTLNMYEGQITVLLGHNGAGKTTTMSMLTGMYTPTSGTAIVGGYDICTQIDGVRDSLGLCPQHNVLFDELTVREHLYFFAQLKGLDGKELEEEIRKYIGLLQLEPKEHAQSQTLSGGMKRKLAAGVALCGKSKVVMFDEPTSGMDPAARRALWDLLQEEKAGRTLLLTTHFMDEADLLGDRIAIMAGGRLKCCGSSFFLKKRYGAGYRLIIVKDSRCDSSSVTALLRCHLPGLSPAQDVGSELSYQLDEAQAARFEPMLRELEAARQTLGVLSYGVSLTTMEEVFMKVGKDQEVTQENGVYKTGAEEEEANHVALNGQMSVGLGGTFRPTHQHTPTPPSHHYAGEAMFFTDYNGESKLQVQSSDRTRLLSGGRLTLNQVHGMLLKKLLTLLRGWILFVIQSLLPAVFLVIVIVMSRSWQTTRDLPPRAIRLDSYTDSHTVMAVTNRTSSFPYSAESVVHKISRHYAEIVEAEGSSLHNYSSKNASKCLEDHILEMYIKNLSLTRHNYIVGVSFDVDDSYLVPLPRIIAWFNDLPYHSLPLALNLVINALFDMIDVSLSLINYPLPYTQKSQMMLIMDGNNIGFQIAFNMGFSMAFVAAYYTMFPVKERISKAKHLQFVSGMEVLVFWGTHLVVDGLSFLVPTLGVIITLAAFQEEGFAKVDDLGRVFTILICFGWAMIPLMYLSSFLFTVPSSGYTRMTMFNIFTGCAAFLVVTILQIPALNLENVAEILDWILMVIPHYCLCDAIRYEYTNYVSLKLCAEYRTTCTLAACCKEKCGNSCIPYTDNYFDWEQPGIGRNIVFFLGMGCIFNIVLLLVEFRIFECFRYSRKRHPKVVAVHGMQEPDPEDSDVREERENIRSQSIEYLSKEFSLVLRDVTKYYGNFLAVDHLCIGIKKGECFGLLGVNGAGKTTTFKMMTGDEKISEGEAYLDGLSLKYDMKQVHQLIGYCPQFDALIEELTGRETLHMFCLLRGIQGSYIPAIVSRLAEELLFTKHIDKKVREYSGGNKRKLSTAVALIGDPPVVFLDEPTTGMDPVAKRHLWNVICKVRDSGTSIILTSHSMEECEALCTRLAIMVNGNFKCLGSTQHLKNKFAEGYTLIVKVKGTPTTITAVSGTTGRISLTLTHNAFDVTPVKCFVENSFPGARLREEYMGLLTYYIPTTRLKWSQMFGMMERAKQELNIEDYSLGQTSLEQVFLTFTKAQLSE